MTVLWPAEKQLFATAT